MYFGISIMILILIPIILTEITHFQTYDYQLFKHSNADMTKFLILLTDQTIHNKTAFILVMLFDFFEAYIEIFYLDLRASD